MNIDTKECIRKHLEVAYDINFSSFRDKNIHKQNRDNWVNVMFPIVEECILLYKGAKKERNNREFMLVMREINGQRVIKRKRYAKTNPPKG